MNELAVKRPVSLHPARQLVPPRIVARRHIAGRFSCCLGHRLQRKKPIQNRPAIAEHRAGRGPDLLVRKTAQRLLHEVHQPGLSLQGRQ